MIQNGADGLRVGSPVVQGGTIEIDVGTNDAVVEIDLGGAGGSGSLHLVPPGKHISIPVPPVPAGTVIAVIVGTGSRQRAVYVEVVSTPP